MADGTYVGESKSTKDLHLLNLANVAKTVESVSIQAEHPQNKGTYSSPMSMISTGSLSPG